MKTQFNASDTELLDEAADLYSTRQERRRLREARGDAGPTASAVEIHAYIERRSAKIIDKVQRAIRFNGRIRDLYHRMLREQSTFVMPIRAAAAGEGVQKRSTDHAEIEIKSSEVRRNRVYILITLTDPAMKPKILSVIVPADHPRAEMFDAIAPVSLPDPVDGGYQLVVQPDDPILDAIMDHDVELCFV